MYRVNFKILIVKLVCLGFGTKKLTSPNTHRNLYCMTKTSQGPCLPPPIHNFSFLFFQQVPIVHAHCHTSGAKQNVAQEKTVSGMFRQQCVSDSDAQHCSPFHVSFVDWFVPVSDAEEIVSFHTCRCFGSLVQFQLWLYPA